jgi:hypothetical protein
MHTAAKTTSGPALEALQRACRYDSMRLDTYREREHLAERIRIARLGSSTALRFDDVGYFNRVYCADASVFERLAEIEDFFGDSAFGCELVGPPGANGAATPVVGRPGWEPGSRLAWMHAPDVSALLPAEEWGFTIREPGAHERERFFHTYLRAFDAEADRIPAAVRNMRHLFDRPELDFLMAWHDGEIVGVGMLMRIDGAALFCAGAVLATFREQGCHAALLAARARLAAARGCGAAYSWAAYGSQSQANMEARGLACAGVTQTWRFVPERR